MQAVAALVQNWHAGRRRRPARPRPSWNAGVAAVEFAVAAPAILVLLGGVVDAGLLVRSKIRLAGAVSAGAQYAKLAGSGVNLTALAGVLKGSSMLSGVTAAVATPACYCPTGSPASLSAVNCNTSCATGGLAGSYVQLSASYSYQPLVPGLSHLLPQTLTEAATVRLQ